ncbi:hypothetical protein BGX23_004568, partial [Mortierella sp. AD031]
MEPALDRFKNMAELVILVASFLDRDDLASFRLTCHSNNASCIPFFYRDVKLNIRLECWTTEGILGLARHPSCVRSLKTDEDSCFLYYASLVKVLTETAPPSDNTTSQIDTSTSLLHLTSSTALDSILPKNLLDTLCDKRCIPAVLS